MVYFASHIKKNSCRISIYTAYTYQLTQTRSFNVTQSQNKAEVARMPLLARRKCDKWMGIPISGEPSAYLCIFKVLKTQLLTNTCKVYAPYVPSYFSKQTHGYTVCAWQEGAFCTCAFCVL